MYLVHGDITSGNCYKVKLCLEELQIPYEWIAYDLRKGETRTPEFKGKHPNGKLPILEIDNGLELPESNAIMYYLARGSHLIPKDELAQAQMLRWMFFEQNNHEPNIAGSRYIIQFSKMTDEHKTLLALRNKFGNIALQKMDRHLEKHTYFVAETFSIADIALFAYTHIADEGNIDLKPYPNIRTWIDRIKRRDRFVPMA